MRSLLSSALVNQQALIKQNENHNRVLCLPNMLETNFRKIYDILNPICWTTLQHPTDHFCAGTDGKKRDRERKLNYSTKIFEGVPIIVKGQSQPQGRENNHIRHG